MVTLVRLKGELFPRLEPFTLQLLDLGRKDGLCRCSRVDAGRLDRDDGVAAALQEVVRVQGDDTGLVRLRNVGKDDVDHREEHAVLVRVTGVLDDGCKEGGGRVSLSVY